MVADGCGAVTNRRQPPRSDGPLQADAAGVSDSHPSTPSNSQAEPRADLPGLGAEPVDQVSVTQAPVAHREGLLAQLVHDRSYDTGAGESESIRGHIQRWGRGHLTRKDVGQAASTSISAQDHAFGGARRRRVWEADHAEGGEQPEEAGQDRNEQCDL